MSELKTVQQFPVVYITRSETFSACHRLHSCQLTDAENEVLYGPCNNANGHGHNYRVEVTVKGKVDPVTGMVMNLRDLKQFIKTAVMDHCDHKHLDKDVPYFKTVVSTTENLAVLLWQNLSALMIDCSGVELYEVRVHETDKNVVFYRGESTL